MKKLLILTLALFLLTLTACSSVPAPRITYAEFPFEIVYELDGETVTVSDVYVCEFDGYGWNESAGKHRQWKGYVKSTGDREVTLLKDGNLKFAVSVGTPEYYMDDPAMEGAEEPTPTIYYVQTFESGGVSSGVLNIEPMLEQYKLRLVSWSLSKPIQNSYD